MKTVISVILCGLVIGVFVLSTACRCEDTSKTEIKSPNGKYVVTLYERDCGATTDFSTIVSLRASTDKFKGKGDNIFVVKGQPKISLVWQGNTSLLLGCAECAARDIFKKESTWMDVNIHY